MKRKNIYLILSVMMLLLSFTLCGCGNAEDEATAAVTESTEVSEVIQSAEATAEPTPTPEPLSPEMSRYHDAVKENTILLAQQEYLNNMILYYQNIRIMTAADDFEMRSFNEEIFGTATDSDKEEGQLMDYPEFDPATVEVTVSEITEEEATAKSEELEKANEELKQVISDLQIEADNLKLIAGM